MDIPDSTINAILPTIEPRPFHTAHFIDRLRIQQPELWASLVAEYGDGGRGAGTHYTAYSRVSQALSRASDRGLLDKLPDYAKAPSNLNWGSPVIRYWTDVGGFQGTTFPEEVPRQTKGILKAQ